jgi:hypothetical protein
VTWSRPVFPFSVDVRWEPFWVFGNVWLVDMLQGTYWQLKSKAEVDTVTHAVYICKVILWIRCWHFITVNAFFFFFKFGSNEVDLLTPPSALFFLDCAIRQRILICAQGIPACYHELFTYLIWSQWVMFCFEAGLAGRLRSGQHNTHFFCLQACARVRGRIIQCQTIVSTLSTSKFELRCGTTARDGWKPNKDN